MCRGCLGTRPGHYTDEAHKEHDEKLFKFIEFCTKASLFARNHDVQTVKETFADLHNKNHRFSYRDFMDGTNTLY